MSQSDGVQHLCAKVEGELCSFPNYCEKSGCLNLPKEQPAGLDLSRIKPLTEAEAEAYFNAPTPSGKYIAAMEELKTLPFVDTHIVEDIQGYIKWLLQAVNNANERYDAVDRQLMRNHDMGQ